LTGKNSQLVTANDYLARRDAEWMGYVYQFLGLSVGCIQQMMPNDVRREMYTRDITYGTASEFGFDYLRDNGMATHKEDQVQRDHFFCIVDEVDSILVDEARTPLIISGPAPIEREQPFTHLKPVVEGLVNDQLRMVNRLASEAKTELEKPDASSEEKRKAVTRLYQVKMGNPKNKFLLRLMENPDWRKLLDKVETELNSDMHKEELYALKEELLFTIDERNHQADLSEIGRTRLRPDNPDAFVLPDLATQYSDIERDTSLTPEQREQKKLEFQTVFTTASEEIHAISQLLRAYSLYERDVEYVVQEGKVMIVDENTGRVMPGRRWSDGLHQAVEAKENVTIERETRTYATITIQNYFRMYEKLAGMTGTAETEATEFFEIYKLAVVVIPTNRPCVRVDRNDSIFKTRRDKFEAVIREIKQANERGQPVLVGTVSVESSEILSRLLRREHIIHAVLNAKFHEQEAEIVSRAGQRGSVTIATNMAGRGTDIKLSEGVAELGGLYVIGTERHESRRIDRQLRGRCARQGDPGLSKFFLSLEDNLMRIFLQGNLASKLMEGSMKEGEELEHPWLNRSIESAQKKVEQQNFSIRKRLLQYDDVLNQQRDVIYGIRNGAIHNERPKDIIFDMIEEEVATRLDRAGLAEKNGASPAAIEGLVGWLNSTFPVGIRVNEIPTHGDVDEAAKPIVERVRKCYSVKESVEVPEALSSLERYVVINAIDHHWQEHLTDMEELRRSIGLRSYGQKDPLLEYKGEAYKYFEEMMGNVRLQICTGLFRSASNMEAFENMLTILARNVRMEGPENDDSSGKTAPRKPSPAPSAPSHQGASHPRPQIRTTITASQVPARGEDASAAKDEASGDEPAAEDEFAIPSAPVRRDAPKVGRNDPCPCGSGKKYKNCHGK
jgi:preprotein translocase subunit SecA